MLTYVATASVACSLGVVIGGMLAASKVTDLYERLAMAERQVGVQTALISQLAETLCECLSIFENRMSNLVSEDETRPIRDKLDGFKEVLKTARQHGELPQ